MLNRQPLEKWLNNRLDAFSAEELANTVFNVIEQAGALKAIAKEG